MKKSHGTSNAIDINGIIEECIVAPNGNVSIGDFVESEEEVGASVNIGGINSNTNAKSIVALNGNKVCAFYGSDSVYACICTIDGTQITLGTGTQVSSSVDDIATVKLNENKIFIVGTGVYACICTIDGTVITKGTSVDLGNGTYVSSVALNENKVFVIYTSGAKLYGILCTINGTTITSGNSVLLSSNVTSSSTQPYNPVGTPVYVTILNENKVFVIYRNSADNDYLYGMVCTINGTEIITGTDTQISNNAAVVNRIVTLNENKVFIIHGQGYTAYGIVCTINGTMIATGNDVILSSDNNQWQISNGVSVVALSENKVFITYCYSYVGGSSGNGSNFLASIICTIDGTNILIKMDTKITLKNDTGKYLYTAKLNNSKVFIKNYNSTDSNNRASVLCYSMEVKKCTSPINNIYGIAKTNASSGETAQIFVPN